MMNIVSSRIPNFKRVPKCLWRIYLHICKFLRVKENRYDKTTHFQKKTAQPNTIQ